MLMVRVDDPTREEVPLPGSMLPRAGSFGIRRGVEADCEKLCGIELVHGARTALEADDALKSYNGVTNCALLFANAL
jgi:hypothetical protein